VRGRGAGHNQAREDGHCNERSATHKRAWATDPHALSVVRLRLPLDEPVRNPDGRMAWRTGKAVVEVAYATSIRHKRSDCYV
jgi:hypothetical protein